MAYLDSGSSAAEDQNTTVRYRQALEKLTGRFGITKEEVADMTRFMVKKIEGKMTMRKPPLAFNDGKNIAESRAHTGDDVVTAISRLGRYLDRVPQVF